MNIRAHTPLPAHLPDIAEVVHIFFPQAQVSPAPSAEDCDLLHLHGESDGWSQDAFVFKGERFDWTCRILGDAWEQKRRRKRALKQCCYYLLRRFFQVQPPWGSLTGIRPTRLFYERLAMGDTPDEAHDALTQIFSVRNDKAQLVEDTVRTQRGLPQADEAAIDIYVGIPFCVSRCAYCSFFAEAVGNGKRVPPYLDALMHEMEAMRALVSTRRLLPRALYVGGGTPTALDAKALSWVLGVMKKSFPGAREFTVEAGRPDTITREKLSAMLDAGVTRLCINPQSMRDETLSAIGRAHTAWDTEIAFAMAREMGFASINMDIIAALPGETQAHFAKTLDAVRALSPDSLTVHTLARKHGSRLNEFGFSPTPAEDAEAMVEMGERCAAEMGMRPYYLYRQKYVAGNLENVGYALPGKESLYNIDIMEETTSVIAMGAGAISKRIFPQEGRIERAPNVGDVGHYIGRVDEMIARKQKLFGGPG